MKHTAYLLIFTIILFPAGFSCKKDTSDAEITAQIQKEAKPWAYWWWMGSSVTREGITANLEDYNRAGLGGLHIIPIYGEKGDESNFIDFLSPEWMEMLNHTLVEAERLEMGIDMTCGTGWPFGGPNIGEEHAAKAFEVIEIRDTAPFFQGDLFPGAEGVKLLSLAGYDRGGKYMDLPFTLDSEGKVNWSMPSADIKVFALFQRMTRQKVKRAAPGGQGFVVDYFSKRASRSYFQEFSKAFTETVFSSGKVRSFYNDSYEVYGANWTNDFPEHFERLRGYSLLPHLRNFADTIDTDEAVRFRVDFLETISDLLRDEFTRDWIEGSHSLGFRTRYQAHGSPGNLIDLYSLADIPETESFGRSDFPIPGLRQDTDYQEEVFGKPTPYCMKFASSAANLSSRRLVSSESATWLGDHFKVSLAQVKPQLDELFVSGINHIFYHGITYSPPDKPFPGRLFYASTNFGPHSHFWKELPALNQYVSNCQRILQNSFPDNDILVYFPIHDVWAKTDPRSLPRMFGVHHARDWLLDSPFGQLIVDLWTSGYTFDYISDMKLEELKVREGKILAGNTSYRAILVPECLTMPLTSLKRLQKLTQRGIPVIFEKDLPEDVPGLHRLEERRRKFSALKASMRKTGKSRISKKIEQELLNSGIIPEGLSEQGLSFIRKRSGDHTIYFVTNLSSSECTGWIPLSVTAESIIIYDPMYGKEGLAEIRQGERGTEIYLQLKPGESRVLTCRPVKADLQPWAYIDTDETQSFRISGKWHLTPVEGAPGLPKPLEKEQLSSWAGLGADWEIFSGAVVYSTTFSLPEKDTGRAFLLELGDVRESARVKINGKDLGLIWAVPFRTLIPGEILKASNTLEIEVRNLSFNRVIDLDRKGIPWKNFHEINFVNIRYEPYDASGAEPMPSGLLGPLTMTPLN